MRAVKQLGGDQRVVAAFPPLRRSAELARAVDGFVFIGDDKVRQAQLPVSVVGPAGIVLERPKHWS